MAASVVTVRHGFVLNLPADRADSKQKPRARRFPLSHRHRRSAFLTQWVGGVGRKSERVFRRFSITDASFGIDHRHLPPARLNAEQSFWTELPVFPHGRRMPAALPPDRFR